MTIQYIGSGIGALARTRAPPSSVGHPRRSYPLITEPPFGCSTCPVMNDESSLARKTYEGAISEG